MKEKKKDFIDLLQDLCDIYKDYTNKNDGSRLDVYISNNLIKMILSNNNGLIDEFGLAFNHKEKDCFEYISIILMLQLFGNGIIYSKDNMFFENIDCSGFRIVVSNDDLFEKMFSIASIHRDIYVYDNIDNCRKIRNKVNRYRIAKNLEERIGISRKLLKIGDR